MKNVFKILLGAGLLFGVASCGTVNDPYNNNGRVYRAPDGTVYRHGDVYTDRNGSVYQNGRIVARAHGNHKTKRLPPGQAKKIYGGKATDYAPGQTKKHKKFKKNKKKY